MTRIEQNNKTRTHRRIQETLSALIPELVAEKKFPHIKRIADLAWDQEKIIFEVQFSQMDAIEARARTHDYATIGYQVVWILHENSFNPLRPTPFQQFLDYFPHYYTNIDDMMGGDFYDYYLNKKVKIDLSKPKVRKQISRYAIRPFWKIHFQSDHIDMHKKCETCNMKFYRNLFSWKSFLNNLFYVLRS